MQTPISPYVETRGMFYFARMLDKIRKHAASELRADFQKNVGIALDERCSAYLNMPYADIATRTLQGGSDEDIFDWCLKHGRGLSEVDIFIWNEYARKIGWNDARTEMLATYKAASNLSHRDDILTMFDFMDADEGHKA